jgi:hypothetical protein
MENFSINANETQAENLKPITLWIPENYKLKYDELQQKSNRRFCKKLRELMLAAIDKTESKAS